MDEPQTTSLEYLRQLLGRWQGNGSASFPTIQTFPYREELEFMANDVQPLLRYEQRTWKRLETGEYTPSHWETGFWRVLPSGEIQVLCAQSGGRVEVLQGLVDMLPGGFAVNLRSVLVGNDARINHTARHLLIQEGTLQYTMHMSTTAVQELTKHLDASLKRA